MFSFKCAQCGHREIAHIDDVEECIESDLWPDNEYQEEPDDYALEDTGNGTKLVRGYKNTLNKCPGFQYRQADRVGVIQAFAQNRTYLEYAPKEWKKAAEALSAKVSQFKPQR